LLEPQHRRGRRTVVVLVVGRQVGNLQRRELELRRHEGRERVCQLAVERIAAEAADDHGNAGAGHACPLEMVQR